ncbi:hypothetical protein COMNV_00768 [Commensalibacter sp. Nvir]|uniref:L,D-transpeptidase family protein n=1 Tax=Commensalibacter sp. Nvir TaxID=3069817 RepID=UPI002D3029C5|nr:hypothetical protein COMNV_00768 [Commensalibacter sp. Nvir]
MMKTSRIVLVLVAINGFIVGCTDQVKSVGTPLAWKQKQQMIIVLTQNWDSNQGVMFLNENKNGKWVTFPETFVVSLGKKGLARDPYLLNKPIQKVAIKREGDYRSPAGLFYLGESFGYENRRFFSYPYRMVGKNDYCIDDPGSEFYNKIIDITYVKKISFIKSKEPMRRDLIVEGDKQYKIGIFIQYNPYNLPYKGSCIFIHVKKNNITSSTAGCTAMNEKDLNYLLYWLRAYYRPIYVLLPISEYNSRKKNWNLPQLDDVTIKKKFIEK